MTSPALFERSAMRISAAGSTAGTDWVAAETPVALVYNGLSHAVMMATPADLADFALGFSLSEGIVERAADCELVEIRETDAGMAIALLIPSECYEALAQRRRSLAGRVGCGLCGAESLADAVRPVARVAAVQPPDFAQIRAGLGALRAAQVLNARCGGLHAAGFVHAGGIVVREDVGRHNALDKLIGAMAIGAMNPRAGWLAITSRASFEVVHKAASAGIGCVVAISAPTALAIRLADEAGVHLIAFAREHVATRYSGARV